MTKAQEIGARIAQARREKGVRERRDIRPAEVARAVKVSGATVSEWEAGKIIPREDAMEKLAAYLDVTPMFLRYGEPVSGTLTSDPAEVERMAREALARAAPETPERAVGNGPRSTKPRRGGR